MSNVSSFWHLGQKISYFVCIYPAFFERPLAGQQTRLLLLPHGFPMDQGNNLPFGELGDFPPLRAAEQAQLQSWGGGEGNLSSAPSPKHCTCRACKEKKGLSALSPEDTNYCFSKSNTGQRETFLETQEQSLQILTFYSVATNTSESLYLQHLFFQFMLS